MSAPLETQTPSLAANCLVCGIPLVGLTAVFLRWRGIRRSPRNPNCCTQCGAHLEEGRLVEMTVVFADLSSFTEMTSHMGANATYSVVDEFLRLASTTLMRHGAFIDKYIGDAVMALFNVPINAPTMWRPRSPRLRSYKSFFPNFPEAWEFNSPQKMGFRSVAMARGMRWEEHFVNPAFKSVNGRDCD